MDDLNCAVSDQGGKRTDCRCPGYEERAYHANGERNIGDDSLAVADHDPSPSSLIDENLHLIRKLMCLNRERLLPRLLGHFGSPFGSVGTAKFHETRYCSRSSREHLPGSFCLIVITKPLHVQWLDMHIAV